MSRVGGPPAAGAAALRSAFDRSFAEARSRPSTAFEDLLLVRAGGDVHAVRLAEVAGLHGDRRITPLPGSSAGLLGIAGLRGGIVPVYDLGALLGYAGGRAPRWLLLARATASVGLAFDHLVGHLRSPAGAVAPAGGGAARPHVDQVVRTVDGVRPIIHIASVVEAIIERAGRDGPRSRSDS